MRKQLVILLAILLVGGAALWAGGQGESGGAPVTVSYMTWDSGKGLEVTQSAVDAFQKKNPNIKVELQSVPEGYDDKVMTANAAGNTPDGLLMWNTSQFAEAGVVANLSPYVMKDNFNIAQYLPVLKSWSEYKGGLWGLPKDYTPRAIYYNKKVFDDAGVAYPQPGWTWADFTDIAKKLTNGKTGAAARYGYVAIPGHTYAIQSYIWMNGGDLCSLDGKTATGYINSSQVVEVVKWYKGLFDMSISTGTMDAYQNLGQTEFQSGIVGMMDNGMWPLATFLGDKSLSFGIAAPPVPRKGVALSPVIHSATWSMFAKAKHKDAAWELIKFLGSPDGVRINCAAHWGLPPIPALADELGFNSDPNLKAFIDIGNQAKKAPTFVRNAKWFEADAEFQAALQKIFLSNADIQSSLNDAAARMDKILQGTK
ncbi:MAG: ABC transporter substrate-binding protein [Spirochaetia bacterium]